MDNHGETAHWPLRLVCHAKKRHCLILSIATAAEQHLRFSFVPASGDFPLPGHCSAPARRDTRYNERGGAALPRHGGSGAGQGRQQGHEPREGPAGAPSPQQRPRSRRGRSLQAPAPRGCQRRYRRPGGAALAPIPTPLRPRSVPVLTGHRAGLAFRSRPSTDQYGGSTARHFRFRGSGAGHSPGAAPLLAPGRAGGAARGVRGP